MTSPLSPEEHAELRRLIQESLDERRTPEGYARLQEWICRDEEAGRIYVQYMQLHARLYSNMAQIPDPTPCPLQEGTRVSGTPIVSFLGSTFRACGNFLSQSFVLTLLLTIGLPCILLVVLMIHIGSQPVPVQRAVIQRPQQAPQVIAAHITRTHQCVWVGNHSGVSINRSLTAGQLLELREGLVEITFTDGARALLEGPVTFHINSGNRGFLRSGKLVAYVPKGAEGFVIATPSATVIDLGTEFGVSVEQNGTTEACVFKGQVDVSIESTSEGQKKIHRGVDAGKAVRVVATTNGEPSPRIEPIAVTSTHFVRHIADPLPEPTIIFAHNGDTDPVTEGWVPRHSDTDRKKPYYAGPVNKNGTQAWSMRAPKNGRSIYYVINNSKTLTPELLKEAKEKGWVLRTRVWVNPALPPPASIDKGLFLCSFRDDDSLGGAIRVSLDREGNQILLPNDNTPDVSKRFLISGSRDQYVDYEIRCHPHEKSMEVYANGQFLFQGWMNTDKAPFAVIRFGMDRLTQSDIRCALVEWGILGETPSKQSNAGRLRQPTIMDKH